MFILDPEDYVKADNLGNIVAVVHSHPSTPAIASQADKVSCEQRFTLAHSQSKNKTVGIL